MSNSAYQEISAVAAADLLGVSRQHVIKLINSGILAAARSKRRSWRVSLESALAFKREMERRSRVLDEIQDHARSLGLYLPGRG